MRLSELVEDIDWAFACQECGHPVQLHDDDGCQLCGCVESAESAQGLAA